MDGTLYSAGLLRVHLAFALMRETLSGRRKAARGDIAILKQHVAAIERARLAGGTIDAGLKSSSLGKQQQDIERRWMVAAIGKARLRDGALEVMDAIGARRLPMVVVSDYTTEHKLRALGISDRFEAAIEGVRLGYVKPRPELFSRAADKLGIPASALLHIGDREDTDGAGARAAGCQVRIIRPGPQDLRALAREVSSLGSQSRA